MDSSQQPQFTSPSPASQMQPVYAPPPAAPQPMVNNQMNVGGVSNYTPVSPANNVPSYPQVGMMMPSAPEKISVGKALASSFKVGNASLVSIAILTSVTLGFSAYTLAEVNKSYEDNRSLTGGSLTAVRWVQGLTIAASSFAFAGSVALLVLKLKYRV